MVIIYFISIHQQLHYAFHKCYAYKLNQEASPSAQ